LLITKIKHCSMLAVDQSFERTPCLQLLHIEGGIKVSWFVGKFLQNNMEVKHKTINDSIFRHPFVFTCRYEDLGIGGKIILKCIL
jgi:hypothetical protein